MIKQVKIKRIFAENFLCFGTDGIEIDLEKKGNIILIKGDNLDNKSTNEELCSNGAGKSSIQDALAWGIYGKTIKGCIAGVNKISIDAVINNKIETKSNGKQKNKKAIVEIDFDDYRIIRTRATGKSTLKLIKSSTKNWEEPDEDLTQGEINATQKMIDNLIGLNYDSFVNLVVFTDNNSGTFLEADAKTKRNIVEDVLSLQIYNQYALKANEKASELKKNKKIYTSEYEILLKEKTNSEKLLKDAKINQEQWILNYKNKIFKLESQIQNIKSSVKEDNYLDEKNSYDLAQKSLKQKIEELENLTNKINNLNKEKVEFVSQQQVCSSDKNNIILRERNIKNDLEDEVKKLNKSKDKIEHLTNKEKNVICESCYSLVKEENIEKTIENLNKECDDIKEKISNLKEIYLNIRKEILEIDNKIKSLADKNKNIDENLSKEILQLNVTKNTINSIEKMKEPVKNYEQKIAEEKIKNFELQKEELEKEESPYLDMIKSLNDNFLDKEKLCEEKNKKIKEISEDEKYYNYWCKGFGDDGIRKLIISNIIPSLNKKTNYWLNLLINGKINIKFNEFLEETIERVPKDEDFFVYHALSGGERRRINLAVSQAFAHIMMLSCGNNPSLVFLDEVTTNIDPSGVMGVYNMILELSKEKKVFVTTHDHDLIELLSGQEKLHLVKQNGITTLVNS